MCSQYGAYVCVGLDLDRMRLLLTYPCHYTPLLHKSAARLSVTMALIIDKSDIILDVFCLTFTFVFVYVYVYVYGAESC